MIDNGSDINQPVKSKTPIEYAIETGIDQIIEYIILNDRFEKPTKTLSFKKNQEYYELLIDKNKQNQQFIDFVRDYNYVGFKYRELFETNDLDTVNEIIELNKNQVITVTDIDYVLDLLRQIEASKSNQLLHKKSIRILSNLSVWTFEWHTIIRYTFEKTYIILDKNKRIAGFVYT